MEVTDRELLELAVKAAGISHAGYHEGRGLRLPWYEDAGDMDSGWWNPLTDDGDALRLAAARRIVYGWVAGNSVWAHGEFHNPSRVFTESNERNGVQDECAALRRAITRAAADGA